MPLPGILLPSSLPPFLIAGHTSQYGSPYADVPMGTGDARKRRVCTVLPQLVSASLLLERDDMASFQRWFRDTIRSGERRFTANVKEQGQGMLWYEAQFAQMYHASALHLGRWRVDCNLWLFGAGELEAPFTGLLATRIDWALSGVGVLRVPIQLRTRIDFELQPSISLRTRITFSLED